MKIVFVGDLHGNLEIVKEIDNKFKNYKKIFVGDYVDRKTISPETQVETFEYVLSVKNSVALMGNHEASYLYKPLRASGYTLDVYELLKSKKLLSKMEKLPLFWYDKEHKILVTHAGLTRPIWEHLNMSVNTIEKILSLESKNQKSFIYWIGESRGGRNKIGGLLWCDWHREFLPIDEISQVIGHTKVDHICEVGNSFNIDCLDSSKEILIFEKEEFKIERW